MSGQLQKYTARRREFQILGDATEKIQAANDACVNKIVSRFVVDVIKKQTGVGVMKLKPGSGASSTTQQGNRPGVYSLSAGVTCDT